PVEAARRLVEKIDAGRDPARHAEERVTAGQLHAMGLIEEILRHVVELYREAKNPRVSARAIEWLYAKAGRAKVEAAERRFVEQFPPPVVDPGGIDPGRYLEGRGGSGARGEMESGGTPNRETVLVEMLMLHLANTNPAYAPFL